MKSTDTTELWEPDDTVVMEKRPRTQNQQQPEATEDVSEQSDDSRRQPGQSGHWLT